MTRTRWFLALALTAGAAFAGESKPIELDWEGEIRLRPETRIDLDLDSEVDDNKAFVLSRLRFMGKVRKNKTWLAFQAQDSRVFGEETSTTSNEQNLDLHQGFLQVDDLFGKGSFLQLGRQEWSYGDERLIGAFGWDNIGRAFDGARARFAPGKSKLDLFWARPARFVEDSAETNQDFFGAYFSHPLGEPASLDVYALGFRDGRDLAGEDPGEADSTLVGAFGARLKGKWDRLDVGLEAVLETGDWRGDELSAFAFGGVVGLTFGDDTTIRPVIGFDYATGDEDPTDGERQEFFNFFPTNHPLYGYADLFGWRNLVSPWGGIEVANKGRRLIVKFHDFHLDEAAGPWKSAGGEILGFDRTGGSGSHVGSELDLSFWAPVGPDGLKLHGGWSQFWPSEFAENTRGEDSHGFGYLQVVWSFSTAAGK